MDRWVGVGVRCGYCIEGGMEFKVIIIGLYPEATYGFNTESYSSKFQYYLF